MGDLIGSADHVCFGEMGRLVICSQLSPMLKEGALRIVMMIIVLAVVVVDIIVVIIIVVSVVACVIVLSTFRGMKTHSL